MPNSLLSSEQVAYFQVTPKATHTVCVEASTGREQDLNMIHTINHVQETLKLKTTARKRCLQQKLELLESMQNVIIVHLLFQYNLSFLRSKIVPETSWRKFFVSSLSFFPFCCNSDLPSTKSGGSSNDKSYQSQHKIFCASTENMGELYCKRAACHHSESTAVNIRDSTSIMLQATLLLMLLTALPSLMLTFTLLLLMLLTR